jgi:hypothetical protein
LLQQDGNFVVLSLAQKVLWESGTSGAPGDHLAVEDNGTAVIRSAGGKVLWERGRSPSLRWLPAAPTPAPVPHDVPLTPACAKAVAPVEKMIHTMPKGARLTVAQIGVLNRVLQIAPKACSTPAEIAKGQLGPQYTKWQHEDLLPWLRACTRFEPTAAR